jgi:hypothetical protein
MRIELAKCNSDHIREFILGRMEYTNEVHGLKAWIEELIDLENVNHE